MLFCIILYAILGLLTAFNTICVICLLGDAKEEASEPEQTKEQQERQKYEKQINDVFHYDPYR